MSLQPVPPIGARIRAERLRQGRSLRGLAREVGVSASMISQIETAKSQPSVSTLYAITTALQVSIEDLFAAPDSGYAPGPGGTTTAAAEPAGAPGVATALAQADGAQRFARDRSRRVGPVVCPAQRETLTLDSGVTWELLGEVPGHRVDFLRVTYAPGASSSGAGLLMRHAATEYGFLISGELVLTLASEEHRLEAGDAVSFESSTPHAYRNDGAEPAVGVWFVLDHSG